MHQKTTYIALNKTLILHVLDTTLNMPKDTHICHVAVNMSKKFYTDCKISTNKSVILANYNFTRENMQFW